MEESWKENLKEPYLESLKDVRKKYLIKESRGTPTKESAEMAGSKKFYKESRLDSWKKSEKETREKIMKKSQV